MFEDILEYYAIVLRNYKTMFGYTIFDNPLFDNDEYNRCVNIIETAPFEKYIPSIIDNINILGLKSNTNRRFKLMFKSANLKIKHIDFDIFTKYCDLGKTELIIKEAKELSVFDVPLHIASYEQGSGCIFNVYRDDLDIPFTIDQIQLTTDLPDTNYTHEVCHALVGRHKGIVKSFLHSEYVPITVELIYGYENYGLEYLSKILLKKLDNIEKCVKDNSILTPEYEREKYIVSSFLAFNTLFKYIESKDSIRTEMLRDLDKIFNGDLSLDDFLRKYEIVFESGNIESSLVKTINFVNKKQY